MSEKYSNYTGSSDTFKLVAQQISKRWGEDEVSNYDPHTNCFTYQGWQKRGFQVQKGEEALTSYTFVDIYEEDEETGEKEKVGSTRRPVYLFYYKQVEPVAG